MKYIFFVYILLFSIVVESNVAERVKLDVPVINQGRALCGPATIEMVFRYWGVTDYDQYWRGKGTNGHYRVVTGYDDKTKTVYLNYANPGKKHTQSYGKFFELWNVDEQWLHYNAIVFNALGETVNLSLRKYQDR